MQIEVSKKTFYLVFGNLEPTKTEQKETHYKEHFYNSETDQRGTKIFNYVSSKEGNFYLYDINS